MSEQKQRTFCQRDSRMGHVHISLMDSGQQKESWRKDLLLGEHKTQKQKQEQEEELEQEEHDCGFLGCL